jgi:ABC-type uncharacterized transport system permease subunit
MIRLLMRSIRYSLESHLANLPNLIAGAGGMLLNNVLFLTGMWGMLFAGKPGTEDLLYYYIALNGLIMVAFGGINFFCGGWMELAELIVSGEFESKLATPRHPLILVSTHRLHPASLGDLIMGVLAIGLLFFLGETGMAVRTTIATVFATLGLFAAFILGGSLAFFIPRGDMASMLVQNVVLSMSNYPLGKVFPTGLGRIAILLTPAAAVSFLPLDWIESAGWTEFAWAVFALALLLATAFGIYNLGVKRFQAINLIGTQG